METAGFDLDGRRDSQTMRYLFIHPVFPGQFHRVMRQLAAQPGNEVVHISRNANMDAVPGVRRLTFKVPPEPETGYILSRKVERATIEGKAVADLAVELKRSGFVPDLIYGYAGWGHIMFMKDVFPNVPLAGYFEWYLNAYGSEYNFDPAYPLQLDHQLYMRVSNATALVDLAACDHGITPTRWQQHQFPAELQHKITVIHDGVDTARFKPSPSAGLKLPGLELPPGTPLVTYLTRGMEPFRGFPQMMRALAELQARHPQAHAVIVGTEEIFYSAKPTKGASYKEEMLGELAGKLDLSRIHFTGWLDTASYLAVLQASWAHVYLTRPYVLSWSLMEAMAAGCLLVGSRTAPVEEMIRHGENGLLTDFFDHHALADLLGDILTVPERYAPLRVRARETMVQRYDVKDLVTKQATLVQHWAAAPAQRRFQPQD
jgi:glycosyltransferase involved in cell wall biosynthesis